MQVGWQKGREVQQLWRHVLTLLAYPHVWIRKAAGRLLGLLLSSSKLGEHRVIPPALSYPTFCFVSASAGIVTLFILLVVATLYTHAGCALVTMATQFRFGVKQGHVGCEGCSCYRRGAALE